MRQHSFRLPSVKAKELWDKDQTYFDMLKEHLGGRVETSENWKCHPCFKEFGLRSAPLTLYGDAVPYVVNKHGKKGSLICLFFAFPHKLPAAGEGSDVDWKENIHVFTVLRKEDLHADTFDQIWDILAWDLQNMLVGHFDQKRHNGKPFDKDEYLNFVKGSAIAGGTRFGLNQFKQDWEFLCSAYGFKTWSADEFCPFCEAVKDPETWIREGIKAHWRCTLWDQTKLELAKQGRLRLDNGKISNKLKFNSKIWTVPHMSILYIKCDPMHVLYVNGVFNKVMACLLYRMTVDRKDLP